MIFVALLLKSALDVYGKICKTMYMDNSVNLQEEILLYQKLQNKLRHILDTAPEGSVYDRKSGKGIVIAYRSLYEEGHRRQFRMDEKDDKTIRALRYKKFAKHVLPKIDLYLNDLIKMKAPHPVDFYKEAALLGSDYRECADWALQTVRPVTPAFRTLKERQNPYPFGPESVDTDLGLFRSKNEALDAKILDSLGVDYLYEPAIILGAKILYPDFAVDLYWKQMIGIIEHHGLLDDPQYRARKLKDLDSWILYGYYPGVNLLILSEHPQYGYDEVRIRKQLQAFCLP